MTADRSQLDLPLEAPDHDQDQARCHPDDHDDETSVGHLQKILLVDIISVAAVLDRGCCDG
jgi:hypothetical protein